jgi:UDP-glucose 4-epimerase
MVSPYRNRKILVTGGLGFIGSNLAIALARAGAQVTVVDSSVPGCGANSRNLSVAASDVRVVHDDIGNASGFAAEIRGCDVIFNLAGEISHIHSMQQPGRDAEINALAQLRFLESCAQVQPGVRVVFASTCRWMRCIPSGRWILTEFTSMPPRRITRFSVRKGGWMRAFFA